MIGFYQIGVKIGTVCRVVLPAEVRALLEAIQVGISLGLDVTAPLECFGAHRYERQLLFWLLLPLILILLLGLLGLLRSRLSLREAVRWATPLVLQVMFLLYTLVNAKAFEAFPCCAARPRLKPRARVFCARIAPPASTRRLPHTTADGPNRAF